MALTEQAAKSAAAAQSASATGPVSVVDIGSNSVRLVVFEGLTRNPTTLFNEKAICAMGRGLVSTGKLDADGMRMALAALARFKAVSADLGVPHMEIVATAAVRDAKNGKEFVARAEAATGAPVRVLTGAEEAEYAAMGVLSGLPDADGLVGDLGGGSLELTQVAGGRLGQGTTLPLGPLRLMDAANDRIERAKEIVDDAVRAAPGLDRLKNRALYAVGGVWRSFARIHQQQVEHPISILHGYEISRGEAIKLAQFLAGQSRKSLERIAAIPKRRAESLPWGALVLERLLKATEIDRVVVSAFGVREGVLFRQLSADQRARDPLLDACHAAAARFGRVANTGEVLAAFTAPLFRDEDPGQLRLRRAACLMADSAWREHPDYRAELAFRYVLQAQIAGIGHKERAFLALTLFHRYAGDDVEEDLIGPVRRWAGSDIGLRAMRLGLALRLAYVLAGSASGVGSDFTLTLGKSDLALTLSRRRAGVIGEPVERRLAELADAFGRTPRVDIG